MQDKNSKVEQSRRDSDLKQMLTMKELTSLLRISRTTIEQMVKRSEFLQPIRISPRRKAWKSSDIEAYILTRTPTPQTCKSERGEFQ